MADEEVALAEGVLLLQRRDRRNHIINMVGVFGVAQLVIGRLVRVLRVIWVGAEAVIYGSETGDGRSGVGVEGRGEEEGEGLVEGR